MTVNRTEPQPVDLTLRAVDGTAIRIAASPEGTRLTLTNLDGMITAVLSDADVDVFCPALRAADRESGR